MRETPFANGSEVEIFIAHRCDFCVFDDPDGGGCDEFALSVVMGERPQLLVEVPRTPANPLGVECTKFSVSSTS